MHIRWLGVMKREAYTEFEDNATRDGLKEANDINTVILEFQWS